MAESLIQTCTWPGVAGVESCEGTLSHGITPSLFILTTYPQTGVPPTHGDLVMGDGLRNIRLRRAKVTRVSSLMAPDGQKWMLEILDRRWRWAYGTISGEYNRLDNRGKLVPWTIRSPVELAVLCLQAMGETTYSIDLPPGLVKADGADLDRYLKLGENFPQTQTNPYTAWTNTNPAEALARLCDQYGRRVIYQPTLDRVLIARPGDSPSGLPGGACESTNPSIDSPETPGAIGVIGAPIRVQMRLRLEPVGEEFDGRIIPVNELSYAPVTDVGTVQITRVEVNRHGVKTAPTFGIYSITIDGHYFEWQGEFNTAFSYLLHQINGTTPDTPPPGWIDRESPVKGYVSAFYQTGVGGRLVLTGLTKGRKFTVGGSITANDGGVTLDVYNTQEAIDAKSTAWHECSPKGMATVPATDRLSKQEAQALAKKYVFKAYRIMNQDVTFGQFQEGDPTPLRVPALGSTTTIETAWSVGLGGAIQVNRPVTRTTFRELKRRQSLILQQTKVEQVVPAPRNLQGQQKGDIGAPGGILPEFYNGYSRDQAATITGSINAEIAQSVLHFGEQAGNTPTTSRVYIPFDIDAAEQMVVFAEPLHRTGSGNNENGAGFYFPDLILETAVLVTNEDTGEVERYAKYAVLGGPAPVDWQLREDVVMSVIGRYIQFPNETKVTANGFDTVDKADADSRANYYLTALKVKYEAAAGLTNRYIGIKPIDPDGAIQQITWSIGPEGPTTIASMNTEHSISIPPYASRRLKENMSPNTQAAVINAYEFASGSGLSRIVSSAFEARNQR